LRHRATGARQELAISTDGEQTDWRHRLSIAPPPAGTIRRIYGDNPVMAATTFSAP
jgi:hypothetical protein